MPNAKRDFRRHAKYLLTHAPPGTSDRLYDAIVDALDQLADMPGMGSPSGIPNPKLAGVRKWQLSTFSEYLVFYDASDAELRVLRLIHSKRDYNRVLDA